MGWRKEGSEMNENGSGEGKIPKKGEGKGIQLSLMRREKEGRGNVE